GARRLDVEEQRLGAEVGHGVELLGLADHADDVVPALREQREQVSRDLAERTDDHDLHDDLQGSSGELGRMPPTVSYVGARRQRGGQDRSRRAWTARACTAHASATGPRWASLSGF